MKVLHVCNYHRGRGGADDAFDATVRVSRHRGLDVELFTRDSRALPPGLAGRLRALFDGVYSLEGVRAFSKALIDCDPDVVHVHELYPLISPWILPACRDAGVPVVMSCSDYRLTCPIATHFSRGEICHRCLDRGEHSLVLRNCRGSVTESIAYALRGTVNRVTGVLTTHVDHYIVPSEFCRHWLNTRAAIPLRRVTVNQPAVRFPDRGVDDPAAGEYIGFAGRTAVEKGLDVVIEAARRAGLPVRIAVSPLHEVGTDVVPGATVVVTQTREELDTFYRACRALVVPSLWYETFSLVAAEAMSHGVPVIASRLGALAETVRHDETGLLFTAGDSGDLSSKMKRLWDDPDLCRRLGSAARERVAADFCEDAHFSRMVSAYQTALS